MPIKFYAPEWGNTLPFLTFCQRVKAAGYEGVEMALPFEEEARQEIQETLQTFGLELIGQYWQSNESDFEAHRQQYERYLRHLAAAEPVCINCQTGKDYFSPIQNGQLVELAARISAETGIRIIHETHRGKALFAAHISRDYLRMFPDLRITLDISHWCAVHESLLDDQAEAVDLAIARTDHIHSRVGYPEGPQVTDPFAPEWAETLRAHLGWWDRVVELHRAAGTQLTITTEFGPAPYMPLLPFTRQPVADQWAINVGMMNLLKARYVQGRVTNHS
ncbi:sugar phosphate isomerase/epimerase [Fibrella sp. USSR17]